MKQSKYFRVSGKVQGVFFRASTQRHAQQLGVSGWVRNCADGDVEGMASSDLSSLREFINWLGSGPVLANVKELQVEDVDYQEFSDFEVR